MDLAAEEGLPSVSSPPVGHTSVEGFSLLFRQDENLSEAAYEGEGKTQRIIFTNGNLCSKEKAMKRSARILSVALAVVGFMVATASAHKVKIVEPGQQYLGMSYNDLVDEWTNWLIAEPVATNPASDPNGECCGANQKGKVWFLASTFEKVADRTCEIPAGKAIFFSLGGVFVSFWPEYPQEGDPCFRLSSKLERVRCDVNEDIPLAPNVSFEVAIDGTPVKDLFAFRAQSKRGGFTLEVPENSLLTDWGLTPGDRYPAVSDGYFMFLKPLNRGKHTLKLRMINNENKNEVQTGVNYTLIVR